MIFRKKHFSFFVVISFGMISMVQAGSWFVRKGAIAANNGTNWNDAWNEMNQISWSAIQPGDTICLAGGTYNQSLVFGKSGTVGQRLMIKRAVSSDADCGTTSPGWNSSYDAQVILPNISAPTGNQGVGSYVTVNGVVENGIKVVVPNPPPCTGADAYCNNQYGVGVKNGAAGVTLQRLEIAGPGGSTPFTYNGDLRGIDTTGPYSTESMTISSCSIHGFVNGIYIGRNNNSVIEYSRIYDVAAANSAMFHENVLIGNGGTNVIFRYNEISNWASEGILLCPNGPCTVANWSIYGNIFNGTGGVSRVLEVQYGQTGPFMLSNNTFVNAPIGVRATQGGSFTADSSAINNIFWGSGSSPFASNITNLVGSGSSNTPFVDYSGSDFRLSANSAAINRGTTFSSDGFLNKDKIGSTRGADGTWDIGAYEYITPTPIEPTTTRYVREGAAGNNSGADWANAYSVFPSALQRGYIYYVADGSYPALTVNDAVSSTQLITIRKATAGDHGTNTGWFAAYGDGVAIFPSVSLMTSYVVFDGVTGGGPGAWNSGHGFEVVGAGTGCRDNGSLIALGSGVSNITIQHVHAYGRNNDYPLNGVKGVGGAENIQLAYNSIHTLFGPAYHIGNWKNVIVENSYMADVRSTGNPDPRGFCPDWHAEGVSSIGTNDNLTFRNNLWDRIDGTAVMAGVNVGASTNWKVYGNVFSRSQAAIAYYYEPTATNKQTMTNLEFYNNTIVDMPGASQAGIMIQSGNNNKVMNNVWYNNIGNSFAISATHDYNYFSDNRRVADCSPACDKDAEAAQGETSPQITTGNPFVNWTGSNPLTADFRLKVATLNGITLPSPFHIDPLGATRGSGGTWDRGAYEFVTNVVSPPPVPTPVTTYYVTQTGAGSRNGTSLAHAWSVADYNASSLPTGGNTIIFSGTITSTVIPRTSGTGNGSHRLTLNFSAAILDTANPRLNVNGQSFLNINGGVLGSNGNATFITFNNQSSHDVTIQNWSHTGSDTSTSGFIRVNNCFNLEVINNQMVNVGNFISGDTINNHDIRIANNFAQTSHNVTAQTDVVFFGDAYNVTIEGNKFIQQTEGATVNRHNDILQSYRKGGSNAGNPTNWTIRYNWFELDVRSGSGDTSWFMLENLASPNGQPAAKVYGNIFLGTPTDTGSNNGINFNSSDPGAIIYFYNNTVVRKNGPDNTIRFMSPGTVYAKNNIGFAPIPVNGTALSWTMTAGAPWNNNWFRNFNANSNYTGAKGGTSDPQFVDATNNNFSLTSNSPCLDAGDSAIGAEYNMGIAAGATWPNPTLVTRSNWDIGAYEYTSSTPPPPDTESPSVPTGLRVSSVTSSQIDFRWNAASDNVGVVGYRIYRTGSSTALVTVPQTHFSDTGLQSNTVYSYQVTAFDAAGRESAKSVSVTTTTLSLSDQDPERGESPLSSGVDFLSFPNILFPSQRSLQIKLSGQTEVTTLILYDTRGEEIRRLPITGAQSEWDGRNQKGDKVAAGTYTLVLRTGIKTIKKKIVVVK